MIAYEYMREELEKLAQGQAPTGLSGLGTHISRRVKQLGGSYNMMMMGMRDAPTEQFSQQLLDMVGRGEYASAQQAVTLANFPSDMKDRVLGTISQLRAQPAIPEGYKSMMMMGAFDVA